MQRVETVFLKWSAFALTFSSSCQVLAAGKGSWSLLLQEGWTPVGMDKLGMGDSSGTSRDIFTAFLWRNKLPMGQAVQPQARQKSEMTTFSQIPLMCKTIILAWALFMMYFLVLPQVFWVLWRAFGIQLYKMLGIKAGHHWGEGLVYVSMN